MKLSRTITIITALSGLALSNIASATSNVWDSSTPWGTADTTQFASWNDFTAAALNTTAQFGTGATLTETSGSSILTSTKNIYNPTGSSSFIATLSGTSGTFDVYLRAATSGNLLNTQATLNGIAATSVENYSFSSARGSEQEVYWKWSDFTGSSLYVFGLDASTTSVSLDQLSLATVSAVPEAETYAMILTGLGLIGFAARRRSN